MKPPQRVTTWQLMRSCWFGSQRFPVYLFFGILALLTTTLVSLNIIYYDWYYYFYYELFDLSSIAKWLVVILFFTCSSILFFIYRFFRPSIIAFRQTLYKNVLKWMRRHHYLSSSPRECSEARQLIFRSIRLSMQLIGVITTAIFIDYYVHQLDDRPYLPVIYAFAGAFLAIKFSRLLSSLFRKKPGYHKVSQVGQKTWHWFTESFHRVALLIPLLVVLPQFIDKVILLGGLVQSLSLFVGHLNSKNKLH